MTENALVPAMPMTFDREQIDLIKRQIAIGASDDELKLFVMQAQRMQLDPFAKQIHMVKRRAKEGDRWVDRMAIQVGIDGYRLVADRTERYAPGREPTFTYDDKGRVFSATAYVKKFVRGEWHEVAATAHYDEYAQTKADGSPTQMWANKPHIMLAKCAESLALRRAFPAELSGVYTDEEMGQADNVIVPPPAPPTQAPASNGNGKHEPTPPAPAPTAAPTPAPAPTQPPPPPTEIVLKPVSDANRAAVSQLLDKRNALAELGTTKGATMTEDEKRAFVAAVSDLAQAVNVQLTLRELQTFKLEGKVSDRFKSINTALNGLMDYDAGAPREGELTVENAQP